MSNVVAIVGRPNVGKSTLYNRLIEEKQAIIDDISGVTRDRQYGQCEWNGKTFTVIDTGGFVEHSDDVFEAAIREQVHIAMEEASVIMFVCDVTTGITDLDDEIANMLRRSEKPVILAINKVDNHARMLDANEFWSLGFEETFFLSSLTGSGTGDLLDAVTDKIVEEVEEESDLPKICILGQPNVGKSSMVNALLGEERNIVTDVAGTTRDSIQTHYNKFGKEFMLIDTAGMRKKAKVHENLEFYSVLRAIKAMEEADVCILMIDATTGIESQDMSIFTKIIDRKKGVVLLVNKWDLIEKETNTARDFEIELKRKLAPMNDIPILFVSALEKTRIFKAVEIALEVAEKRKQRIKTSALNDWLEEALIKQSPPAYRGTLVKIKYVTQLPLFYPAFAFFCNYPDQLKGPYKNYLENRLRKTYDFTGVPITLFFRKK